MAQAKIQSTVAGVGFSPALKDRMAQASKSGTFWKVAGFGAAFLGAFGLGASYLMDRQKNNVVRKNQLDVLAEYYRYQIAGTLGMNPENVTAKDLQLAAQVNPSLRQAIQKVETERNNANRTAAMASGGTLMLGGMIPGVSGVAKIGVDLVGGVVGASASTLFQKDVLHVNDMVEYLDGKIKSGQAVTKEDIIMLNASQDEKWQEEFKSRYKTPFHKMKPETQQQIIASMPHLLDGAQKKADGLNSGMISPQSLVMEGPQSTSNYADSVISKAQQGSFVSNEASRRLAAQQQQTALN